MAAAASHHQSPRALRGGADSSLLFAMLTAPSAPLLPPALGVASAALTAPPPLRGGQQQQQQQQQQQHRTRSRQPQHEPPPAQPQSVASLAASLPPPSLPKHRQQQTRAPSPPADSRVWSRQLQPLPLEGAALSGERFGVAASPRAPPYPPPPSLQQQQQQRQLVFDASAVAPSLGAAPRHPGTVAPPPPAATPSGESADAWPATPALSFEARFECGNLLRAWRVGERDYELEPRGDAGAAHRHVCWFFFAVRGAVPGRVYRFALRGLTKPAPLLARGVRPVIHSAKLAATEGVGWHRNGIATASSEPEQGGGRGESATRELHTMHLSFEARFADDTLHFAHAVPYSFSQLEEELHALLASPAGRHVRVRTLGYSPGGIPLRALFITDWSAGPDVIADRAGFVVTARAHPSETCGSFAMRGLLAAATGDSAEAAALRSRVVLLAIPMLNPDGVIAGCGRCSLGGADLNRHWRSPHPARHSTVLAAKRAIAEFHAERRVLACVDLHGHSKRLNAFLFGCGEGASAGQPLPSQLLLPQALARLPATRELFSLDACDFAVQRSKLGTARAVVWSECAQPQSFTLEMSLAGSSLGTRANTHFGPADYEAIGAALVAAARCIAEPQLVAALPPPLRESGVRQARGADWDSDSESETEAEEERGEAAAAAAATAPQERAATAAATHRVAANLLRARSADAARRVRGSVVPVAALDARCFAVAPLKPVCPPPPPPAASLQNTQPAPPPATRAHSLSSLWRPPQRAPSTRLLLATLQQLHTPKPPPQPRRAPSVPTLMRQRRGSSSLGRSAAEERRRREIARLRSSAEFRRLMEAAPPPPSAPSSSPDPTHSAALAFVVRGAARSLSVPRGLAGGGE